MRLRDVARFLVGSTAVYLLVSACSGSGGGVFGGANDASADGGSEPEVVVEACNRVTAGGDKFAEHDWPGKSEEALSRAVAVGHVSEAGVVGLPAEFTRETMIFGVRDGAVAASCKKPGSGYESVTFILPP